MIDDVTVTFYRGKITGLIGPNGAGKTTLFNILNGFIKPDEGVIYLGDIRIDCLAPFQVAQLGVGRMFQDTRIFAQMSVLDNVLVAIKGQSGETPFNLFAKYPKIQQEEKENRQTAIRWLEFVGLSDKMQIRAENLSYGQQKLLALARLLAGNSSVLLLDEPTAGVDPGFIPVLLDFLKRLKEDGKTIILIEHNMTAVLAACDWVYFMDEGKITAFGLPEEVLSDPTVRNAYLGL
ncbi:MAG: ATP-binding cassette domain-containing protein [candidate division WOR-3 bacterium]